MIMTSVELKTALEKDHELLCLEDLADFHGQQGSIFSFLEKHRKTAFKDQQRLVFYSSNQLSQEFVNHIQRAVASVDVGNFFILLVTPYDITVQVQQAQEKYRPEDVPLSTLVFQIADSKPFGVPGFYSNTDTMCIFPFSQVFVDQIGGISPCCNFKGPVDNISNASVSEVFNSDKLNSIRQQLVSGTKPPECDVCWNTERSKSTSLRTMGLAKHIYELDRQWFDAPKVRGINVNPSTLCNFKCRICGPKTSTSFAIEEYVAADNSASRQELKKYIDISKTDFSHGLFDDLTDVENLHILGGEPFKWPKLHTALQQAIDADCAKDIHLEFNTNGSILPDEKLIDSLLKFKSVEILMSIDDIGDRFELQRGGTWSDIVKNIVFLKNLSSPTFTVKLAVTINIQNLLYLDQLVEFSKDHGLKIVWWYLDDPKHMSIDYVTQKVKDLVKQRYENHSESELRTLVQRMSLTPPITGTKFLDYMETLDARRGQSFAKTHKEIFDAMKIDSCVTNT